MPTPLMNLDLPIVGPGGTPGPQYGTLNNAALTIIDGHDHSPGSGAPIKTAGLQVDADLSFRSFNATVMRTAKFDDQVAALGTGDVRAVYVVAGDLYYNNGAGANVRITDGTSINAASIGGIGGDYGTSTANVSYSDTTKTFSFTQDSGIAAHVAVGDVVIFEPVISANGITLQSPSALAGAYALTLPAALPGSTQLLQSTSAGVLSGTTTIPVLDITTSKINNLGIRNPGDSFQYNIVASAIVADRSLTIPLLLANDVLVTETFIQTLTGKTLITPAIASFVNAAHDHADAAGGGGLGLDVVDGAQIIDDAVDSEHIAAGAIDLAHMSVESVDSDQYVDNSIDTAHYAPGSVDQAAIDASAVGRGELNTSTGTVSTSTTGVLITLASGQYGFWPRVKNNNALNHNFVCTPLGPSTAQHVAAAYDIGTSFLTRMWLGAFATQTITAEITWIDASGPYDLGNGEIPLFMFVVLDSNGDVESIYIAPTPPWAYNGPTSIMADFIENGRKMKRQRILPSRDDPGFQDALRNPQYRAIEITQSIKQADMPLIPHPFGGSDLTGKTVVLLEPTGQICADLCVLHEAGVEDGVSDLLHKGYLEIGNNPLDLVAPPGVMPVSLKWRNTR